MRDTKELATLISKNTKKVVFVRLENENSIARQVSLQKNSARELSQNSRYLTFRSLLRFFEEDL